MLLPVAQRNFGAGANIVIETLFHLRDNTRISG
jgi:hypothetical protein